MLYHTLYPVHHKLGIATALRLDLIPEARDAIPILKDWIRDLLNRIRPRSDRRHFLTDVTELVTLAFAFDRAGAQFYVPRTPFMFDTTLRPFELMRGKENDRYIVYDLIEALDGSNDTATSACILFLQ